MGLPEVPGEGRLNCSRHTQPLLNSMESPGAKVEELTLAMVSHGLEGLVPLLESLPTTPQFET